MSGNALVSMALHGESVAWKNLAAVRGQQLVALLLTYLPLAERMLLYHMAMTAWIMLPSEASWKKPPNV